MLVVIITVPIIVLHLVGGFKGIARNVDPGFFNVLLDEKGNPLSPTAIISGLAWGLGYFGMPHILVRFMAVRDEKSILPATIIAGFAIVISLGLAVLMGIAGSVFIPGLDAPEGMFVRAIKEIFMDSGFLSMKLPGSIFLCGILAAIMSTADSQLLVTASAIANDIYRRLTRAEHSDRHFLAFSRVSVVVISFIAYIIAINGDASITALVSVAWSGFGSCFGALVLFSLYWKRINIPGAAAGIISGGLTVIIWEYAVCIPYEGIWTTLSQATGIYSLAPGFIISAIFIPVISIITKEPPQSVVDKFEQAAFPPIFEE
jgi:sodium/proline symporter